MGAPKRNMRVLAAGGFVSGLTVRLAEPLLPKIAEDLSVTISDAAVVLTGFSLAYGVFQLVHGKLSERFGLLRTVSVMMMFAAFATFGCALSDDLNSLTVFRFLTGMTAGAIIPLSFAYVGEHVPMSERQPALARFISGILIGQILGPLVGGVVSDWVSWRATFIVPTVGFFAVALALVPAAIAEGREAPGNETSSPGYLTLLGRARVQWICGAVAIESSAFHGAFAFIGAYTRITFEASFTVIGILLAGFGIGGVLYSTFVRQLLDKLGVRGLLSLSGYLMFAGFVVIPWLDQLWLLMLVTVALGFGMYAMHNTLQTRATEMATDARAGAISLFAVSLFLGQALGIEAASIAIGIVGYSPVFLVAAVTLALLAAGIRQSLHRM